MKVKIAGAASSVRPSLTRDPMESTDSPPTPVIVAVRGAANGHPTNIKVSGIDPGRTVCGLCGLDEARANEALEENGE